MLLTGAFSPSGDHNFIANHLVHVPVQVIKGTMRIPVETP